MADDTGGFVRIGPLPSDTGGFARIEQKPKPDTGSTVGALWQGLLHGAEMTGRGIVQAAEHMPTLTGVGAQGRQKLLADTEQGIRQSEQAYHASPQRQAHPIASGIGRFGGEVAATAPLAALPGGAATIPARLGAGAISGAVGAATQPVTGGDYWAEKAKQVGLGAGAGAAVGGLGGVIGPPLTQKAQDAISRFPHLSKIIRGTALRSLDNFNRAAVDQALDPIGVTIPKTVKAGHEMVNAASDALSDAYQKVLPQISLQADPRGVAAIRAAGDDIVIPEQKKAFDGFIQKYIEQPLQKSGGTLDGEAIKRLESIFGRKAASFVGSADAGQRELGDALYAAREAMMDAVAQQNPTQAPVLQRVNQAYAMFARIRSAATRRADSEGVFTPQDLAVVSRTMDKSAGKGNFAKGDALMQGVAEAAKGPMSVPKVNRILMEILGTVGGHAAAGPAGAAGGAVMGAASPRIARGIVRATQNPLARGAGRAISGLSPASGAATGRLVEP